MVLATLSAPYAYTWDTTTEAETTYSLTARAKKTGTADVVSAARQVTVDRTAPTVTFQVPAANATGILLSNDIALTFSEVVFAPSITDASVKLEVDAFPTPYSLARTASLNSVGTKLTLKATHGGTYPIPVDLLIAGVTDLAGNIAVVDKTRFTAVAPAPQGAPSVEVVVLPTTGNGTTLNLQVLMRNFSDSRVTAARIYLNGKFFAIETSRNNDCALIDCFTIERLGLTSYDNGTYEVTASVRQEDETETTTTTSVPLVIDIKNFDGGQGGWSTGAFTGIPRPALFGSFNPNSYAPRYEGFRSVRTGINGDTIVEVTKQYRYQALSVPRSATKGLYFKAIIGTTSSDYVTVRARDCKSAQECTVWNSRIIDTSNLQYTEISVLPPNFGDTAAEAVYMEIQLYFNSSSSTSDAYIGNIFVGQY